MISNFRDKLWMYLITIDYKKNIHDILKMYINICYNTYILYSSLEYNYFICFPVFREQSFGHGVGAKYWPYYFIYNAHICPIFHFLIEYGTYRGYSIENSI